MSPRNKDIGTTKGSIHNNKCTSSCPEKCSPGNWNAWNRTGDKWEMDNTLDIESGKVAWGSSLRYKIGYHT